MPTTVESLLNDPNPWTSPQPLPGPLPTERLVIRFFAAEDVPSFLRALEAGRDALMPWMVWARIDNRNPAECHYNFERFRRAREAPGCTDYPMGIFDKASGEVVGGTGFHNIAPGRREAEIGYWIRSDRWGQGLVTESTAALITAALSPQSDGGWGFRRLVIHVGAKNQRSAAVPRKLGMRLELVAKQQRWVDPLGYVDMLGFAVLNDEWDFERRRALAGVETAAGGQPGGR